LTHIYNYPVYIYIYINIKFILLFSLIFKDIYIKKRKIIYLGGNVKGIKLERIINIVIFNYFCKSFNHNYAKNKHILDIDEVHQ